MERGSLHALGWGQPPCDQSGSFSTEAGCVGWSVSLRSSTSGQATRPQKGPSELLFATWASSPPGL